MNALVTGASSGIGKEIARALAKRGFNLVLIARSVDKLQTVSEEIENTYGVNCYIVNADLSISGAAEAIFNRVKSLGVHIDVLVNDAGFGKFGDFYKFDLDTYKRMIHLNVLTLTELTYLFGKEMIKNKRGWILNIASTAAFQPIPNFAVYAATKAYVKNFSNALYYQMRGKGVVVSTLCPGPTRTNFGQTAETIGTHMFNPSGLMDPGRVAEIGLKGLFMGKVCIIPGFFNNILAFLAKIFPLGIVMFVTNKVVK